MTGCRELIHSLEVTIGQTTPDQLGAGLCARCRFARENQTRRLTTYVRCARAGWDPRLARYPYIPVFTCVGYEQGDPS